MFHIDCDDDDPDIDIDIGPDDDLQNGLDSRQMNSLPCRREDDRGELIDAATGQSDEHLNASQSHLGFFRAQSTSALRVLKRRRNRNAYFERQPLADRHIEESIVTPFAQILHSLRFIKSNLIALTTSMQATYRMETTGCMGREKAKPEANLQLTEERYTKLSAETLEELDWCLQQLETIQTHRSVSEMTTSKFKQMLNRELSQFAETCTSGNMIYEYIAKTFLDEDFEDVKSGHTVSTQNSNNLNSPPPATTTTTTTIDPNLLDPNNGRSDSTARRVSEDRRSPMHEITGVRRLSAPESTPASNTQLCVLPKYGVLCDDEATLEKTMEKLDEWGVDIFKINELTNCRPLTATAYTILMKRNIPKLFSIPNSTLVNLLNHVEQHYDPINPYHNCIHAADVTQSVHVLLNMQALQNVFSDLEIFATIFASAIHDIDHPGLTNNYLINTGSELAIMYNDESVLENHHLAVAYKLLQEKDCDILAGMQPKTKQIFRKITISIVLATDMNKHMDHVAHLKTMIETRRVSPSDGIFLDAHTDRILILQHLVHCADLSNPTKPVALYKRWTRLIMEEFFRQGDAERSLGIDISPMCDRDTATIEKSQVGFIDYIVYPLWESLADLIYPDCKIILENLEANREWYVKAAAENEAKEALKHESETKTEISVNETSKIENKLIILFNNGHNS